MKGEPAGKLNNDTEAMASLGLDDKPPAQLAVAAALILSKPISIAEATMFFCKNLQCKPHAKCTLSLWLLLACAAVYLDAGKLYTARPADLGHMTLYE